MPHVKNIGRAPNAAMGKDACPCKVIAPQAGKDEWIQAFPLVQEIAGDIVRLAILKETKLN